MRKGREPSTACDHFVKIDGGDPEDPKAECIHCQAKVKCHVKRNGTSSLICHKNSCPMLKALNVANVKGQSTISFKTTNSGEGGTKELAIRTYSPERIRLALAKMIILDELPFRL